VGSGGSLSACRLLAQVHEHLCAAPALALTPWEFLQRAYTEDTNVLLLSAGGSNPDILAAATHAVRSEYHAIGAACARQGSALEEQLGTCRHATVLAFALPTGKDGFLATNTLLATCVLLVRGYAAAGALDDALPITLPALADEAGTLASGDAPGGPHHPTAGRATDSAVLDDTLADASSAEHVAGAVRGATAAISGSHGASRLGAVLGRPHLLVLASGWAAAAATDLESKWSEAGFGAVTVTDPRNFAHGRHTGLARRAADMAVLALATPADRHLLGRTLAVLPATVPAACVETALDGAPGALDLLLRVFSLTGAMGARVDLDPGRPTVPEFGRRLYHMSPERRGRARGAAAPGVDDAVWRWLHRKLPAPVLAAASPSARTAWVTRAHAWIKEIEAARFGSVVFDYDGTLCEADERLTRPAATVGRELARLIADGARVGIATGRGRSVLPPLRAILPPETWSSVLVGLYNGGVLLSLADECPTEVPHHPAVIRAAAALESSPVVHALADVEVRPTQVTLRARQALPTGLLRRAVSETLLEQVALDITPDDAPYRPESLFSEVQVLESSHSLDLIPRSVSKCRVVDVLAGARVAAVDATAPNTARRDGLEAGTEAGTGARASNTNIHRGARRRLASPLAVLRIGDQGRLHGNDVALLAHPHGLSVEAASTSLNGCWNIAPPGERRTAALLRYLRALQPAKSGSGLVFSVVAASTSSAPATNTDAVTTSAAVRGTRKDPSSGTSTMRSDADTPHVTPPAPDAGEDAYAG
jgi:hydroxymethylpyrimidine pyrophosphatase-like HAD family hydrolase